MAVVASNIVAWGVDTIVVAEEASPSRTGAVDNTLLPVLVALIDRIVRHEPDPSAAAAGMDANNVAAGMIHHRLWLLEGWH